MSDQTERGGSPSDRKTTLTQTMALTGASATGAIVVGYLFQCAHAHVFLTPSQEQSLALLAIGGPFLHLIGKIIMYWTGRLLPKDAAT